MSRKAGVKTSAFSILKNKQKHSHTGSLKEPVCSQKRDPAFFYRLCNKKSVSSKSRAERPIYNHDSKNFRAFLDIIAII